MTTQQIQLHVLSMVAGGRDYLRRDAAKALNVKPEAVDAAMARCALVTRVTANGGSYIRYRLA